MAHEPVRLTQHCRAGGCGCKLPSATLTKLLADCAYADGLFPALVVDHSTKDDAAVLDIGDGKGIISTTDFFTPIVDNSFDFGVIAATNAVSDVYAMGGKPLMAISVMGWPADQLDIKEAGRLIKGARSVCQNLNIPLCGGHSIQSKEPFFGLAVTGIVDLAHVKRNNTAQPGNALYLTKPLGVGIYTTALKRGVLPEEDYQAVLDLMRQPNAIGEALGHCAAVTAMTDVTGFGLLGHLMEMCEGSKLTALLDWTSVRSLPKTISYLTQGLSPGGTKSNYQSAEAKVTRRRGSNSRSLNEEEVGILCDPQTSGGLLIAVDVKSPYFPEFEAILRSQSPESLTPVGKFVSGEDSVGLVVTDSLTLN